MSLKHLESTGMERRIPPPPPKLKPNRTQLLGKGTLFAERQVTNSNDAGRIRNYCLVACQDASDDGLLYVVHTAGWGQSKLAKIKLK